MVTSHTSHVTSDGLPRIFLTLPLILLAAACQAQEPPFEELPPVPEQLSNQVKAELIAEHASIQPSGSTRIGVHFDIEEGWHIYADPPGDAGLPTQIVWAAPFGSFGSLQWPTPHEFLDPGDIRTSGYERLLVLTSRYTIPAAWRESPPNPITISAKVKWLACRNICIPGSAQLDLSLPISDQPPAFSTHAQLFEQIQE